VPRGIWLDKELISDFMMGMKSLKTVLVYTKDRYPGYSGFMEEALQPGSRVAFKGYLDLTTPQVQTAREIWFLCALEQKFLQRIENACRLVEESSSMKGHSVRDLNWRFGFLTLVAGQN
jgi:hypothetical protein